MRMVIANGAVHHGAWLYGFLQISRLWFSGTGTGSTSDDTHQVSAGLDEIRVLAKESRFRCYRLSVVKNGT